MKATRTSPSPECPEQMRQQEEDQELWRHRVCCCCPGFGEREIGCDVLRSEARDLSFLERFFKFKQHLSYQPAPLQLGDIDTPGSRSGESVSGASPCCTWGKGVLGSLASLFPFPEGWRKRQASSYLPSLPASALHIYSDLHLFVCVHMHTTGGMWRSEVNSWELVSYLYHVGPMDLT